MTSLGYTRELETQVVEIPTHPLYTYMAPLWREYRLGYDGGHEYLAAYLRKHPKEVEAFYRERLARAYYPNKLKPTVDTYAAYLYQRPIKRESESSVITEMWADMDRKGTDADAFFARAGREVQITGSVAVVVDRYQPGTPRSRADEHAMGIRPYGSLARAEDVIDWDVDERGEAVWAIVRERDQSVRTPFGGDAQAPFAYRLWTREGWSLHRFSVSGEGKDQTLVNELVDQGEHGLGRVPIVWAFWGERMGDELVADSALKDLSPANRKLTNFASLIDEQCHVNVFSILVCDEITADTIDDGNWGTDGMLVVKDGTAFKPFYLSADVNQIAALRTEIEKTEDELRMMSGLGRVNNDAQQVKSGVALSYLTMDKQALLGDFARVMQALEEGVAELAAAWMDTEAEFSVQYPRRFDPGQFAEELERALAFAEIPDISAAARRANARAATAARFKDSMDAEELAELLEQVDAEAAATPPADTVGRGATRAAAPTSEEANGVDTRGER